MTRIAYCIAGLLSLALGAVGTLLPLLPTVPFLVLAAFCFARGNPEFERRLLRHRVFGPPIRAWRSHGVITPPAKRAALAAFALSGILGMAMLTWPWSLFPLPVAIIGGAWILSRPSSPPTSASREFENR